MGVKSSCSFRTIIGAIVKREKIIQLIPACSGDVMHYTNDNNSNGVERDYSKNVSMYALTESGEIYALLRGTHFDKDVWMLIDPPVKGYNMHVRYNAQLAMRAGLDKDDGKDSTSSDTE